MKTKNDTATQKIDCVLKKVRPYIQMHGGDVVLEKIENDTAYLKISGACVGCSLASITYDKMITVLILEKVPSLKKVIYFN